MQPFHWESERGNFGDDLNLWLWDFLLPGFREAHPDMLLVGVGTVLNRTLLPPRQRKLIVGSGFGYGAAPDFSDKAEWDVRSVRGPLTAAKLGLDEALGIVDPAVMVADMPEFRAVPKVHDAIFVPHWESTVGGIWPAVCQAAGLAYVDPCGDAKTVIGAIAGARLVVAESMHAAILADALRVPFVAVTTSRNVNGFKWQDWASSLGLTYQPRRVPVSSRAEAITKGARFWGVDFERKAVVDHDRPDRLDLDETEVLTRAEPPRSALRDALKHALAAPSVIALRQASKAEPQLSADAKLTERKDRFRDVLAGIRRDYF
ncbi:polysaccharide pyruvyl transferase family protein [Mesorhizobium sp. A623]